MSASPALRGAAATAADIAFAALSDLLAVRVGLQAGLPLHDLERRAESALDHAQVLRSLFHERNTP